jgi:hypothetical protein
MSRTPKEASMATCEELNEGSWTDIARLSADGIPTRMRAERESRSERVHEAFVRGAADPNARRDQRLFDAMWLGDGLDEVNAQLMVDLDEDLAGVDAYEHDPTNTPLYGLWDLSRNLRLLSFYGCFGSRSAGSTNRPPARLSTEVERRLLDVLWRRTVHKNDIAIARNSTWWLAGSENHDLNTKVTNLISSRIFADDPDYAERRYPDTGHGDAYGYQEPGYGVSRSRHALASRSGGYATWSDGNQYTPREHYEAWIAFFMEYFAERARRGFLLENGSPTYMKVTVSYILLLHTFCGDAALKRQIGMFLDLFWADWAVQQVGGVLGGPKTRHHHTVGGYDAMSNWARFYLGGPGCTEYNYAQQLIGDYGFPQIVWELVTDHAGRGPFAYVSRGVGEEETTLPRPAGTERTMLGDTESKIVRYSWVTPDYVLGTQMDHPLAVHNHLSAHGRWQGLVTGAPEARLVMVSLEPFPGKTAKSGEYSMELMFSSVQHRQVLVTQQARRWSQINPDWFPTYEHLYDVPIGIWVGPGWQTVEERDRWVFLERDDTFVAIRVIRCRQDADPLAFARGTDRYRGRMVEHDELYRWNDARTIIVPEARFSPIIVEAGRRSDHPDLAAFERYILANRFELHRTVAANETRFILVYEAAEAGEIVFNAANPADIPTVAGVSVDYEPDDAFDSPYIRGRYGDGVVVVRSRSKEAELDFNRGERSDRDRAGGAGADR